MKEIALDSTRYQSIMNIKFFNFFKNEKVYPFGTAVLNSSSNESTVGLEADMLLGERSIGLESPFIPLEEIRFSMVIDISIVISLNKSLNKTYKNKMLTSFLIMSIVMGVA